MPVFKPNPPPKTIKGPDGMSDLVAEVARIDHHIEAAKQREKSAKFEAAKTLAKELQVVLPGRKGQRSLDEYRQELVSKAQEAAEKNPDLAMADGKKSRNYPAGTVGYEKQRDAIVIADPAKRARLLESLAKNVKDALVKILPWKSKEKATAAAMLKSAKISGDTVTVEVDPKRLDNLGLLDKAGYKVEPGQDLFTIRPIKSNVD